MSALIDLLVCIVCGCLLTAALHSCAQRVATPKPASRNHLEQADCQSDCVSLHLFERDPNKDDEPGTVQMLADCIEVCR